MPMPIKVAIVGGSIAGCTLANGLTGNSNIAFDVFDSKPSLRERGAGVAIAPNAQKALRAMGLDADGMLKEAGAMKMNSTYCLVGLGEHKGEPILTLPGGVYVVDRMHWLELLLKHLPKDRLHVKKKLSHIEQPTPSQSGKYALHFEDGSAAEGYDVVIGCDGSRSKIRELVLGPERENEWSPRFGGYWDARGRMTPEEAAQKFGTELFDPTANNEVALVGQGAFLLFAPTDNGAVYHVVVSALAGPNYEKTWKSQLSREFLEESYRDWDKRFRDGMIDALMAEDSGPGVVFSEYESPEASTYYRAPGLVIMGDAAHTTIPWMGQGACLSTEDAAVLSRLLGKVDRPSEVFMALKAFDETRRGRPESVVRQSQEAAKLLTGQISMNPEDVKHLGAENWWTDVWNIDMEAHVQAATERFQALKET